MRRNQPICPGASIPSASTHIVLLSQCRGVEAWRAHASLPNSTSPKIAQPVHGILAAAAILHLRKARGRDPPTAGYCEARDLQLDAHRLGRDGGGATVGHSSDHAHIAARIHFQILGEGRDDCDTKGGKRTSGTQPRTSVPQDWPLSYTYTSCAPSLLTVIVIIVVVAPVRVPCRCLLGCDAGTTGSCSRSSSRAVVAGAERDQWEGELDHIKEGADALHLQHKEKQGENNEDLGLCQSRHSTSHPHLECGCAIIRVGRRLLVVPFSALLRTQHELDALRFPGPLHLGYHSVHTDQPATVRWAYSHQRGDLVQLFQGTFRGASVLPYLRSIHPVTATSRRIRTPKASDTKHNAAAAPTVNTSSSRMR